MLAFCCLSRYEVLVSKSKNLNIYIFSIINSEQSIYINTIMANTPERILAIFSISNNIAK